MFLQSRLFVVILPCLMSLATAWTTRAPLKMGVVGSVGSTARRVRDSILSKERSREDLKLGIAGFYDRSSKLWEHVWGEVLTRSCCRHYSYMI
jgi:hypothetical protein